MKRRTFLGIGAAGLAGGRLFASARVPKVALGYEDFSVRAMGWKAPQLIGHAAKLGVDTLSITDLGAFESLEDEALAGVKRMADEAGVKLQAGTWSVCPTSQDFKDTWGSADEHLQLGLRVAKALGSPVIRVILGSAKDRLTDGGIEARIDDMVAVLKRNKSRAVDAGVKIAVENHAGDLHSLELVGLVEAAGPDFVGVNLDAGNAPWALEDPLLNLENLGKHVLTASLRDSVIWKSEEGVTVQWTAMGEGMVDWKRYFERYAELCPEAPVHIETISGFNRELKVETEEFWEGWPQGKPEGYAQFMEMAAKGEPKEPWSPPEGVERAEAEKEYQLGEVERSLAFCRKLGLGLG